MDAVLRAEYRAAGPTALAARLGVPEHSVRWRAGHLKLTRPPAAVIAWTPEAEAVLREHYSTLRAAGVAALLGCTPQAACRRAGLLGLRKPRGGQIDWTPERDALLRQVWGVVPGREVARRLGTTVHAVREHASKIGLRADVNRARQVDRAERNAEKAGILLAWEKGLISPGQAALALNVPPGRLPRLAVEVAMWAARSIERRTA